MVGRNRDGRQARPSASLESINGHRFGRGFSPAYRQSKRRDVVSRFFLSIVERGLSGREENSASQCSRMVVLQILLRRRFTLLIASRNDARTVQSCRPLPCSPMSQKGRSATADLLIKSKPSTQGRRGTEGRRRSKAPENVPDSRDHAGPIDTGRHRSPVHHAQCRSPLVVHERGV